MSAPLRVLAAPDSFKGTFGAAEVAAAIAAGAAAIGAECDQCPLADGGEGTSAILAAALGGEQHQLTVQDPLGRPITAAYWTFDGGRTAAIDVAAASGLPLLTADELDPFAASTYGTGELIAAAIRAGADRVLVAAGGSATVDGGLGVIDALRDAQIYPSSLLVLCDTQTVYEDAARIFGPQKGASDAAAVTRLADRLDALANRLPRDPRGVPMSGAAGGLAGGLRATYNAELVSGAEYLFAALDVGARSARADLVITGEGRLDEQSIDGKLVGSLAAHCATQATPLHVIAGDVTLDPARATAAGITSARAAGDLAAIGRAVEACLREHGA